MLELKTNKKYGYYDGGIIRHGVVPETDLTPEVNFSYAPLTVAERASFESKMFTLENKDVTGMVDIQCEELKLSLKDWDLKKLNPDGSESTVDHKDIECLNKIDNYIIDKIFEIINRAPVLPVEQVKN